jgi:hypothetical protein
LILSVVSLALASAALAVSERLAYRQVQVAERATNLPVVLNLFRVARDREFIETQRYARDNLRADHPPEQGLATFLRTCVTG